MPYPDLYDVTYSYTGFEQSQQGISAFPGTQLDADLAGITASIASLETFVESTIRSDGALNNGVVTYDSLSPTLQSAGLAGASNWATGTFYATDASVITNGGLYRSTADQTSGVFATDLANGLWLLIATLPMGPAGGQGVAGAQGNAGATGPVGPGYKATSATSLTIGTGSKVFATQAGLAYAPGSYMRASSNANPTNYMEGTVTAYAGLSLTVNVTSTNSAGTFADWNLNVIGAPGGSVSGLQKRFVYTAAAAQTTFTGADNSAAVLGYSQGFVEVIVNGLWLPYTDYTATDGVNIVLNSASNIGDTIYVFALSPFNPADTLAKSQNGADITNASGFRNNIGIPAVIRNYIAGLILASGGGSSSFSVAAGVAVNSTNVDTMVLAASLTKTTASWAVGAFGALDTGTIANSTWYHVHLIKRVDTGVIDVLCSLSATAPTMPTNYTLFRRLGSMKTDGSAHWVAFIQTGDQFDWVTPVGNFSGVTAVTTAQTLTLADAPTGVVVIAQLWGNAFDSTSSNSAMYLSALAQADVAAGTLITAQAPGISGACGWFAAVLTNTSAQIRYRMNTTTLSVSGQIHGWIDSRGKNN